MERRYERLGSTTADDIELDLIEPTASAGRWWHQKDLDGFFRTFYQFFDVKGLGNYVTKGFLDHLNVVFVIFVVLFLSVVVDYGQLQKHIEDRCPDHESTDLMSRDCHGNTPIDFGRLRTMAGVVYAILVVISLFWMWSLAVFLSQIPRFRAMREFYEQELSISHRELQTISWDEVVLRVIKAQERLQLCTVVSEFDALDVTNLITRKRNFYIALYRHLGPQLQVHVPLLGSRVILSESLQWNIEKILATLIFDGERIDDRVWNLDTHATSALARKLGRYCVLFGLLNLLLAPAILVMRVAYFFFHNSDSLRKSAGPLAARNWSPYACWLLRNWTEVDHKFRARLARSCKPATKYIDHFVSVSTTIWARFLVFIFGGLFLVLTVLGFVFDEDFMFANLTPERSVLWWSGVLGILLAGAQALIVDDTVTTEPKVLLDAVNEHIHYYPKHWHGRERSLDTFDEFSALFQFKGMTFVEELLSILVVTPYLLVCRLPHCSEDIIYFFRKHTYKHASLGHFCAAAFFQDMGHHDTGSMYLSGADVSHESSSTWRRGGHVVADRDDYTTESSESLGSSRTSGSGQHATVDSSAKLGRSVAAFVEEHPSWNPTQRTDVSRMSDSVMSSLPSVDRSVGVRSGGRQDLSPHVTRRLVGDDNSYAEAYNRAPSEPSMQYGGVVQSSTVGLATPLLTEDSS